MFTEYLLTAKENNLPVSIYTDNEDTEKFSFGFIQGVSDKYVIMAHITPFGNYDGYITKKTEDIHRIEINDKYGLKVFKLYSLLKQTHKSIEFNNDNLFFGLVKFAYESNLVVNIELFNSDCDDLQGFVSNISDDILTVKQIDGDGQNDGESIISLNDITFITCDSDKEIALKLLYESHE